MRIELGTKVECADGACGEVGDVVIDPLRRVVTHLVVEPHHRHELARLVPVDDLDAPVDGDDGDGSVRLRHPSASLRAYPEVNESVFVRLGEWPPLVDEREIGVSTVLTVPFSDVVDVGIIPFATFEPSGMLVAFDRIPVDQVEIRRGSEVEAKDGRMVGKVGGFVVGPAGAISHLVLERGRLWGRREVSIPVDAIARLHSDRIELELDLDPIALDALPSSPLARHGRRRPA